MRLAGYPFDEQTLERLQNSWISQWIRTKNESLYSLRLDPKLILMTNDYLFE
jgi:hypothetical protein